MFQDEFVSRIKFDPRFTINALCTQLRAELAFWLRSITSRLPGAANLALVYYINDRFINPEAVSLTAMVALLLG